jgi:hypothetical protein
MKMNIKIKKILWVIVPVIIILLIGVYGYNKYQKSREIHSMNKIEFSFLKCISNCPIIHSTNKSSFKSACLSNCTSENKVPADLQKKYTQKQLIKDGIYLDCVSKIDVRDQMTYEKYQNCLVSIFPKLQEKYSYLKGL